MTSDSGSEIDAGARRRSAEPQRAWICRLAGLLCALVGFVDVASAALPADRSRLRQLTTVVPGAVTTASAAATLASGLLLLLLARGLRRRKRRAWRAAVLLLAGSAVMHVLKGLDVEEAALSFLLLLALLAWRDQFAAKGDPRTRWRSLAALLALLLVSTALGTTLILLRRDEVTTALTPGAVLSHVAVGLVGVQGPLRWRDDPAGRRGASLVGDCLLAMGLLTAISTAYLLLRPAEPPALLTAADEQRVRALLRDHGERDSLGYFATRRDKSLIWSASGKAGIAYRVLSGVILASGDPVGDPEAWPGVITAFMALAAEHAWVPAVIGCSEMAGKAWARAGLAALELGDEAVLNVETFALDGRAMRGVRQAVARTRRAGYSCDVHRVDDLSEQDRESLRQQASNWRGAHTERGFSMALGRFGEAGDEDCVAVLAYKEEVLRGFLHFVPWGRDGLSLDLMRRDRTADNGLNELLIVAAIQAAPTIGVRRLSLNFAVFRSSLELGARLGAGPVLRGWRDFLVFTSRWFQIESLYRFNLKFRPLWEPRFFCYPRATDLPRIALAALEAEAFLVWPRLPRLRPQGRRPVPTTELPSQTQVSA